MDTLTLEDLSIKREEDEGNNPSLLMVDNKKIELVKKIIMIVSCFILLFLGFAIGSAVEKKENPKKDKTEEVKVEKEDTKELSTKDVETFLIAYYTKKDVGENRNRYEPLVTTSMINELHNREEQPVSQAYKGYIVNQVFDNADIYVDTQNSTAISLVNYKYTKRANKGSDEGALLNQTEQEAIKITFQKLGKQFLVNKVSYVSLTELQDGGYNNYKIEEVPLNDNLFNEIETIEEIEEGTEETEESTEQTEGITNE